MIEALKAKIAEAAAKLNQEEIVICEHLHTFLQTLMDKVDAKEAALKAEAGTATTLPPPAANDIPTE